VRTGETVLLMAAKLVPLIICLSSPAADKDKYIEIRRVARYLCLASAFFGTLDKNVGCDMGVAKK
jgi:hypothetical protein